MVFLAIDHSGGSTNNNIYMLASVAPSGRNTTDVMFVRSTDGGLTFSAPRPDQRRWPYEQVALVWHIRGSSEWTPRCCMV